MNVRSALLTLMSLEQVSGFRLDSILGSIKQRNCLTPSVESSSPHSYSKTSVSNYVSMYLYPLSIFFIIIIRSISKRVKKLTAYICAIAFLIL